MDGLGSHGDLDSDYLFVWLWSKPLGRPLSYPAVTDLFGTLARRTGIAATPHMFRHSYATRPLRAGVKAEIVQKLLGHASVSTTIDTYAHLTIEDVRHDLVTEPRPQPARRVGRADLADRAAHTAT